MDPLWGLSGWQFPKLLNFELIWKYTLAKSVEMVGIFLGLLRLKSGDVDKMAQHLWETTNYFVGSCFIVTIILFKL